jgi:quinolinate synthase
LNSVENSIQLIRIGGQPGERGSNPFQAATVCDSGLAEEPWRFDAQAPSYGPGASVADRIPANAPRQGGLPEEYRNATPAELDLRIRAVKHAMGDRLVILGHFYQRDEVVQYADFVGDSFQLANAARTRPTSTPSPTAGSSSKRYSGMHRTPMGVRR